MEVREVVESTIPQKDKRLVAPVCTVVQKIVDMPMNHESNMRGMLYPETERYRTQLFHIASYVLAVCQKLGISLNQDKIYNDNFGKAFDLTIEKI